MVVRVLLVAHGSTAATRTARFPLDEPLEPGAVDDARTLGSALPMRPGRAIALTGPELRCQQTAAHLGLENAQKEADLRDWQAGDWAGRSLEEVAQAEPGAVQRWLHDPDAGPGNGETLRELLDRLSAWLDRRADGERIIAVTHPAVVRAAAVHALTAGPPAFWRIDVPPLATLSVSGERGRWSVRLD